MVLHFNKKLVALFIICITWSCNTAYHAPKVTNNSQQADYSFSLLDKQIENVKVYINSLNNNNNNNNNVCLALGVGNNEPCLDRFHASYIFLNKTQANESDPRSLSVDFNNLEQLEYLSAKLANTFDQIILDYSTFKFTHWFAAHCVQFKKLLKPQGKFIFATDVEYQRLNVVTEPLNKDQERILQQEQLTADSKKLISTSINFGYWTVDGNGNSTIASALNRDEQVDLLITHNHVPILKEVFGTENVQVEQKKSLPFTSSFTKDFIIASHVITATKSNENANVKSEKKETV